MKKNVEVAFCYDFDGTLAAGNMQEYGFMDKLGITRDEFWRRSDNLAKVCNADNNLCYLKCMLDIMREHNMALKRADFADCGKSITLFQGVKNWFDRINRYAAKRGVIISHYLISSGLQEITEGTAIADKFAKIYACSFIYNDKGEPVWPARIVNYTDKTQYLFRINKGCLEPNDRSVNMVMPEDARPVPFNHMVYFGDGETDIPCMSMIKRKGGYCISVYEPNNLRAENNAVKLFNQGRVNFCAVADYTQGKVIDGYVKGIIDKIAIENELKRSCKKQEC